MTDKADGTGDSHHGHDHHHESSPQAIRAEALESLLIERGLLKASDVDHVIVQDSKSVLDFWSRTLRCNALTDLIDIGL